MSNFWGSLQYAPALCVLCALTRDDFYMQSSSPTKLPWKSGRTAKNSLEKVTEQRKTPLEKWRSSEELLWKSGETAENFHEELRNRRDETGPASAGPASF